MSDREKELRASPEDKPKYVCSVTRHEPFVYFHFCSGVILEKDDNKSDDENETKKKSRAAGPLEIVRKSI